MGEALAIFRKVDRVRRRTEDLQRVFDAPDPVINATTAQADDEVFAQAALSVPLKEGWSVETSTSWRAVMSNYDLADSENISVSLAAMKKF